MVAEAQKIRNPVNGWLVEDCDGMLWTAKYAAAREVEGVNIEAAEYPSEPGRFERRPAGCWEHRESASSWSRDMGMGLFVYSLKKKRLDILERHAKYGKNHEWFMGDPRGGDYRTLYTPTMVGILYQVIYSLGGENDLNRKWPSIYSPGLDDYQAHLQVLDIWLRTAAGDKPTKEITGEMLDRLEEHAGREPYNPFYAYALGLFTGDMSPAISLLLDASEPVGSYVRCGEDKRRCILAERIFTASMTVQWIETQQVSLKE